VTERTDGPAPPGEAPTERRRRASAVSRLVVVCGAQLAAAAALEGAVRLGAGAGLRGIALLAVAAVAATVALAGVARRVLGAVLAAAGAAGVFAAGSGTGATVLAVVGISLLVAAGVALLVAEPSLARPGARYAARDGHRGEVDPDRRAWEELDAGRDPTQGQPGDGAV
jgi:tryptophan-associated transmembrane protein